MAPIAVRLFGSPTILFPEDSPEHAPLGGKAMALLAYLLLQPGSHSRERLASLLWGDYPDAQARASLRQALKQLREAVGDAVQVTRADAAVAPGAIDCDVLTFLNVAATDPQSAARHAVPQFFAGATIRHAPLFDEWLAETRAMLLRRHHAVLGAAAREAMKRWQWREATELAECWQQSDPLSDEAARLAVEATFLSGDRAGALARYREFRARLVAEGMEPGKEMQQLVRRIETEAAPAAARPITADWNVRPPSFETSLVGRERELEKLERAWRALRKGTGRIALLEGEAGVGKTRLAEELLRRAVADGGTVLRGRGYDARSGVPFGPVVEALRSALQAPGLAATDPEWLAESARLLPELRQRFPGLPEPTPPPAPAESWRLFEAVAQLLLALSAEHPTVVFLDDLQWCDADSCNLLHFLIRRVEAAPILWCLTLTLGELQRDAPAARLSRVLRTKPHAVTLPIEPLDEESVWRLVRELSHVTSPTGGRRFAARLHQTTAGNPFYIVELLKTLFAQGWVLVDSQSGEWRAAPAGDGGSGAAMAPTVHDAIAERIESLPAEVRAVLITIAVAGACRTHVLSHVHGISRLRAATMADELVERRLLTEEDGVYRCAHPVIARVVRDGLTSSRRREVHRVVALALEIVAQTDGMPIPPGEIARHADLGGERAVAYRHALLAGRAAMQRYAYEEALSWLDLAAANAAPGEETETASRLTEEVVSVAGWREVPAPARHSDPVHAMLEPQDLDLPAPS